MKKLLLVLFVLVPLGAIAQTPAPSVAATPKAKLLAEINKDVWLPFIQGVNSDQPDLYIKVRSRDFYWVAAGAKGRIMNYEQYVDDSKMVMKKREGQQTTELEVRFLERNINSEFAAEKVIIRYTLKSADKAPEVGYGVSQYFSRKENGVWKMWIQHANLEKGTAEAFERATPLQDVES